MNRIELEKFLNNKIVNIGNLKRKIFENSILMKSIEDNNLGIKKKVEYQVSVMKNDDGKLLHSNADKRSFAVSKILEEDAEFQKNLCIVENNRKLVFALELELSKLRYEFRLFEIVSKWEVEEWKLM